MVPSGISDLKLLMLVFAFLKAWWIFPLIKSNNKINKRGNELREEIKQLEKLLKNNLIF